MMLTENSNKFEKEKCVHGVCESVTYFEWGWEDFCSYPKVYTLLIM